MYKQKRMIYTAIIAYCAVQSDSSPVSDESGTDNFNICSFAW